MGKCDIYSFGVVALEVLMGRHPAELLTTLPSSLSSDYEDLLLKGVIDQRIPPPSGEMAVRQRHGPLCDSSHKNFQHELRHACLKSEQLDTK